MSKFASPFRSADGERDYMAAYEATMRLWPVSYDAMNLVSRFGSTHIVVCGPTNGPPLVILHCFFTSHNMGQQYCCLQPRISSLRT
jgi:hypothetical protein